MFKIALNRTLAQLTDSRFQKVLFISIVLSVLALALTGVLIATLWPADWTTGIDIIDGLGLGAVMVILSYFLFPSIAVMIMGVQLEAIIDAVEDRYYPDHKGRIKPSIGDAVLSGLGLLGATIALNLLAVIPYLLLLFITGGVGTLGLAVLLNGYLIGREYFQMVAERFASRKAVTSLRKARRGDWLPAGLLIAAGFLVPVINILAPIAGIAFMTHIFHQIRLHEGTTRTT